MTALDRGPSPQGRRGRAARQSAPIPIAAAAPPLDPHLIRFLDLLGGLIAERIVAEASAGAGDNIESTPSLESPATRPEAPGISGPIPTVPADSRRPSRLSPATSRTAQRRSPTTRKESHHAPD